MGTERGRPVLSGMQQGAPHALRHFSPIHSRLNSLMHLHSTFLWHHHDLCLFHQVVYGQAAQRDEWAHKEMEALRSTVAEIKAEREWEEWDSVQASRVRETVNTADMETAGICTHADQLLVIGLWALVELYCSRALTVTEEEEGFERRPVPHRWPDVVKRYRACGVDVRTLTAYTDVDRCRTVNNKIKHAGIVEGWYAERWPIHKNFPGGPLEVIDIDVQALADAVFEFVGHVMEACGDMFPRSDRS